MAQISVQQPVNLGKAQNRKVNPEQQLASQQQIDVSMQNYSRLVPAQGEFYQLIGEATDGMLARFVQNRLSVMFWHRAEADPDLVFGAQIRLAELVRDLRELIQVDSVLRQELCVALLDDNARPVALSQLDFSTNWKRPFVASEISEALPHWEVAVYLLHPDQLAKAAQITKVTIGLLVTVLTLAIGVGGWLILSDVNRQLRLTRQKTDFVSNVSHELKTPLTSIRMFSELLAEGTVKEPNKQRSYLRIIASESARLTRLINNVLDFARMDRGEKKYEFRTADLGELVGETVATYRPHLQSQGFTLKMSPIEAPLSVKCDRDALSQVITNLLSNAEKYSNGAKEIVLEVEVRDQPVRHAEVRVLDRGPGVPSGCEERIFGQFYRADDSLNSGVQGSGLGLTLARQIARAHGGDVTYKPREGGGSCFTLSLPVISTTDGHG
jgi:signal transduction histidine kinase